MPELPEVETYVRDLRQALPGRLIEGVVVSWPNQLPLNQPRAMDARVHGQRVREVDRRGKYIVMSLDLDWLIVHLKMSGRLQIVPRALPANPHAHVVFSLDADEELRFHDPRKFGRVYLVADPSEVVGHLGPEPMEDSFHLATFAEKLAARRARLKPLLLDQRFIAGLGNIYVDECLWTAGIHPLRSADSLAPDEVECLYQAIRSVLARAVKLRGTSFSELGYRDLTGNVGEMQGSLNVFRRTDEPCPRCGSPVVRLVVAGRATHVCERCQV
jgi:formamidopyrimidine-DNA glycosylase